MINVTRYEYMGEPIKSIMESWLIGVKDPATDPKWRRRQRIKRVCKKALKVVLLATGVSAVILLVNHFRKERWL